MRSRAFLFVSVLVLAGPVVTADGEDPSSAVAPCEGFAIVHGQGPSCPVEGGWRVLLADGTTLMTHGPDPKPEGLDAAGLGDNTTTSYPPLPPACANSGKAYLLIYMVPFDKTDRYGDYQHKLRDMVNRVNGHLRLEAQLFGDDMSYRFRCDPDGRVRVEHVVSSVSASQTDTSTWSALINDLRAKGYKSTDTNYLVFWDNGHCCYGGQGNVHHDDRLVAGNANNNGGSYAIVYGYTDGWGMMTMAHEIGHNIGAVQLSSPNSSGSWHCNDGLDTMCYKDSPSAPYKSNVCTDREHFDCNHDDYFNPSPPSGSYLASHWNLASRLNVWFDFTPRANQAPTVTSFSCFDEPSSPGASTLCGLRAEDPDIYFNSGGGNLTYTIDWGDGTQSVVGPYSPVSGASAAHAWAQPGQYTVTVTATDDGAPPLTSAPFQSVHEVRCNVSSTGQLVLGTAGVETPLSARRIAIPSCWGSPYTLTGSGINDFDACFYEGTTLLSCDRQEGNNAGTVPAGTTHVHVVLVRGAAAVYRLTIG